MSRTIADLQESTIIDDQDEILFYQNSTKTAKKVKRGNFFSSRGIVFKGRVVNPETNEELWDQMGYNETIAKLATASVHGSQNSASGSVQVYYRDAVNPNISNPVPTPAITNPSPANGDIWYLTNGNYKAFVYNSSTSAWERSTKSLLQLDANSNVSGLVKVGDTSAKNFVMVADNFEITNSAGAISGVPFAVRNYSAVFTGSIAASGTDGTATLTVTAVTSGPIRLNMVLTGSGVPTGANTPIITAFLTGTGDVGTYIISPFSSSVASTTITGTVQGVRITEAIIETVDIGKATAGFLSSQAIELPNENSYIQSKSFIEEWVTAKQYKDIKTTPSDQTRVRIKQTTGIYAGAYKVYKVKTGQTHTSSSANKPGSGASWTTYWDEVNNTGDISTRTDIQGFRIVGSGQIQLSDAIIDGDIWAKTGHFGNVKDSVRIDSKGLVVGDNGYIKSAGLGFNGTSGTYGEFNNGPGFFLGNTSAESTPTASAIYQFFIGNPSANHLRWNGTNLLINGSLAAFATGTSGTSGFGLTIGSGFGIRYINNDAVLTITGGRENGVSNGAQIDLVGSGYTGGSGSDAGLLILQAGSGGGSAIRFSTNVGTDISGKVGATRLNIDNTGLVTVVKSQVVGPTYTSGAGNLYVQSNLGVGLTPDPQNGSGDSIGKVWASEEVTVYNGAIRSAILKKTDGAGMGFFRNGDDEVTITLDGRVGEITASSYNATSSKRFKKKIKNLKNGLSLIDSLRPVVFDWKKRDKRDDIGLIAEEVYEILPSIVKLDEENKPCAIDYSKLTPILIQAVKELFAEVEKLKNKMHHGGARN